MQPFTSLQMEADMLNIIVSLGILLVSITAAFCSTVGRPAKVTVPVVEEVPAEEEEAPVEEEEAPVEEEEAPAEEEDSEEGEPNGPPPGGDDSEADEMAKPEIDYLKAQLDFYRGEKDMCEAKMRNPSITMNDYTLLKKHWDGLDTMITGLEEVIA